jgi:hypothetical protein
MRREHNRAYLYALIAAAGLAVMLAALAGTSTAQENAAEMTVQAPSSDQIIKEGGEDINVNIIASDVHNLAAFQFALQYNASVLKYVGVKEGVFLGSTGREVNCLDPRVTKNGKTELLQFDCVTLGAPVSLGGKAGPDGSGVLATVTFSPTGGGTTALDLSDAMLVAAEIDSEGMPVSLTTSATSSSVDVIGTGGGFPWLIVGLALGGVVVIGAIGGGLVLVRRRS